MGNRINYILAHLKNRAFNKLVNNNQYEDPAEIIKARNRFFCLQLEAGDLSVKDRIIKVETAILERICEAYLLSKKNQPGSGSGPYSVSGIWEKMLNLYYGDMITALNNKNMAALQDILGNIFRKGSHGLSMSGSVPDLANPKSLDSYINKYADDMLRLALFLNIPFVIKDMDNEFYIADRKITAHELWELISERINLDPVYPNVGNPFGMFYKSGKFESVIPSVAFRHIHMALMACSITKNIEPASIMEIGGGFGGVLFYIAKLLKKSIALQSIDIPEINVISAYFLSKALPDVKIILYGENTNTGGNAISIQPNWVLKEIPPDSVSLVINTDSFPEMPEMTMLEYLGRIAEISRYFYSVNQDCGRGGQNRLSQTDTEKLGLECINYNIAWMRRGYFERLYRRKPVKDARAT